MCNIFSEFGTATRIITLIKLCFKINISNFRKERLCSDNFTVHCVKQKKNPQLFGCPICLRLQEKRVREESITSD